jgi:hypothetical protein
LLEARRVVCVPPLGKPWLLGHYDTIFNSHYVLVLPKVIAPHHHGIGYDLDGAVMRVAPGRRMLRPRNDILTLFSNAKCLATIDDLVLLQKPRIE